MAVEEVRQTYAMVAGVALEVQRRVCEKVVEAVPLVLEVAGIALAVVAEARLQLEVAQNALVVLGEGEEVGIDAIHAKEGVGEVDHLLPFLLAVVVSLS